MTLGDDDLRRAFADDRPPGRDLCPAPEELAELAAGTLGEVRRLALADHLATCGECAGELQALGGLEDWAAASAAAIAPRAAAAARTPRRTPRSRVAVRVAAVAAVLVVAALVPYFVRHPSPPAAPVFRSEPAATIHSLVPEDVPQARGALVLRWTPVEGALGYAVTISTLDLARVDAVRGLTRPEYAPPAKAFAALPPHTRLLWVVEAQLPDGLKLATPAFAVIVE